jgi:hypothetical protein
VEIDELFIFAFLSYLRFGSAMIRDAGIWLRREKAVSLFRILVVYTTNKRIFS